MILEDCLSVTVSVGGTFCNMYFMFFFFLIIWRPGGVTGLPAYPISVWLSFSRHPTLLWAPPVRCTSRGLPNSGKQSASICLNVQQTWSLLIVQELIVESYFFAERGSLRWGRTAYCQTIATALGKAESVWFILLLLLNGSGKHQLWSSSSQLLFSCFLPAAGSVERGPWGVNCSLRRMKGYIHLFSEGHGRRYFACAVTGKPHHQSGFAVQGLQKRSLVSTAPSTLPHRGWVMPVCVTQ